MNILLQLLQWISVFGNIASQIAGGGVVGKDVKISVDLVQIAQQVLALHTQNTGKTMDEVLAQFHDTPPITLPTEAQVVAKKV